MYQGKRYAIVRGLSASADVVNAYLPSNYKVIHRGVVEAWPGATRVDPCVVIEGTDDHGWTLDGYVIPRLGSGLMRCDEIDLSHPIMKEIPL